MRALAGWRSWANDRNARLAAVSLLVGTLSYWAAHRYLRGQEVAVQQRVATQFATRDVVVAAIDVPAGGRLEPALLARRAVPERFLASDAVTASEAAAVAGRRVQRALRGGEPVTTSALEADSLPTLSSLIEPGLRAVTIPVDDNTGAAGMLVPGDLVDLLLVTHPGLGDADGDAAAAVRPLLQAVRVVATGHQVRRARGSDGAGSAGEADAAYATVTLHVRPEDAERVLLAQRVGELNVVLRTPGDSDPMPAAGLDSHALFGVVPRAAAARGGGRMVASGIEFIIGGVGRGLDHRRSARVRSGTPEQP